MSKNKINIPSNAEATQKKNLKEIKNKSISSSFWLYPLIFVFILIAVFSYRTIIDIDIGFHLKGGQWILDNFKFHDKDVFTYTVNQNEYIALHWLYQVVIFLFFKIGGYPILTFFNLFFILVIYAALYFVMKQFNASAWLMLSLIFLSVFANEFRFIFRPEIFTWLFFVIYIFILNKYYLDKNQKLLFLLPILQIVWVNSHGLFIIGIFVIFCYWIDKLIRDKKNDKTLLKYFLFSIGASLLNPYFINGLLFPFYLFTRLGKSNVFKILIGELKSPFELGFVNNSVFPSISAAIFYVFIVLVLISIIINYKKIKIHQYIILAATFYISYSSVRNIPLFIFYSCIVIAYSLTILFKEKKINLPVKISNAIAVMIILFSIGVSVRICTGYYYSSDNRGDEFGSGLNTIARPEEASEFLTANKLDGRIANDIITGSWLMWKIPQPVFIDGRLEVMQEKFAYEYGGSFYEGNLTKMLTKYKAEILVFNYSVITDWTKQIVKMNDWRLVHLDKTAAVYLKSGYREDITKIELPDIDFDVSKNEQVLERNIEGSFYQWVKGFCSKSNYSEIYRLTCFGYFMYMNNDFLKAEKYYLDALQKTNSDYDSIYNYLSVIYEKLNEKNLKNICLKRISQQ